MSNIALACKLDCYMQYDEQNIPFNISKKRIKKVCVRTFPTFFRLPLPPVCLCSSQPPHQPVQVPSPGICSPAFTMTISLFLSVAEETAITCSFLSTEGILCASTSFLEAHRASACAFPRPSAIASAKLAKIQVNHRIIVMAKV